MKKLFFILMFLCCSFLYAETRTFKVDKGYSIRFTESTYSNSYAVWHITAILPYEGGYVVKLLLSTDKTSIEYFFTKGLVFYMHDQRIFYKCTVVDIKPNEFTAELEEIKKQD